MNKQPASAEILIVEDEIAHAEAISEGLVRSGHRCRMVHTGEDALLELRKPVDIVVTDLMLGGEIDGMGVLEAAGVSAPEAKVILITAHSSVDTCRAALQQGAFDYIEKPLNLDELRAIVARAARDIAQKRTITELRGRLDERYGFDNIIGQSEEMLKILDTVNRIARADIPVLILGESGTGKDLIANAIHQNSQRSQNKFVVLNCAGLTESLLEDELFGHAKGAYTGAATDRLGRFEHADGGTMFLDEVGDMPMSMQAKLLRVLENGEVFRIGSNEPIVVDVRIISATNTDLSERVAEKLFREDLYFRIKGATLDLPPLRQRRQDIPLLIEHFIADANRAHNTKIKGITAPLKQILTSYSWPGNVRQLRNVINNMVVMSPADKLTADDIPGDLQPSLTGDANSKLSQLAGISIEDAEKQLIANTLDMVSGNRSKAADMLGIGERTLYRKIKEYGIRAL